MTDIAPFTQDYQSEDRSWDLTPVRGDFVIAGTLSVAAFDQATHYPNGYIPSGILLGKITASGLLAPYLGTAADGSETAVGILRSSVHVLLPNGLPKSKIGVALLVHGVVDTSRLPFTSDNAADVGGFLDAGAKTDLPLIYFV